MRRILPEISPDEVANLLGQPLPLPATDFSIVNQDSEDFDMNRLGILDIFLAVIAKSLQLQVKIKSTSATNKQPTVLRLCNCIDFKIAELKKQKVDGNKPSTSKAADSPSRDETIASQRSDDKSAGDEDDSIDGIRKRPEDTAKNLNQRWFLKGTIHIKQAENIIGLIRDMGSVSNCLNKNNCNDNSFGFSFFILQGKLSEKWSAVTKAAIAEAILNLTRLDEVYRTPTNCVKTATLWLALASLCVLDKEHVQK